MGNFLSIGTGEGLPIKKAASILAVLALTACGNAPKEVGEPMASDTLCFASGTVVRKNPSLGDNGVGPNTVGEFSNNSVVACFEFDEGDLRRTEGGDWIGVRASSLGESYDSDKGTAEDQEFAEQNKEENVNLLRALGKLPEGTFVWINRDYVLQKKS